VIIINEQIISPLLITTLEELNIPILLDGNSGNVTEELSMLHANDFFASLKVNQKLLTNSESCLKLIESHIPESNQNLWSKLLKNKGQMREILATIYPNYFYNVVSISELFDLPVESIPFPVVLKPTFGYSSVGVYKVKSEREWEQTLQQLNVELVLSRDQLNQSVINSDNILIEEWIQGEEYAIDGYYDEEGNPVILNMFKRLFKDEYDTSDRIYYTSKQVVNEIYESTLSFMLKLRELVPLKNYPIHFEIKKHNEKVMPIEINPIRFAGAGTTDLGFYAYGNNVYKQYFNGISPDWESIIEEMDDAVYSFCCAEIPLTISSSLVENIEHDRFKEQFDHILEYREIEADNDRTFAIVFFKSKDLEENHRLLHLNLEEFVQVKKEKVLR
jgi:hypothetical protein